MKTSDFFDTKKIHELYPGAETLLYPPQLIHKATDTQLKACDDGTWFAQLKKDGALYMYVKGLGGENYLFGRTKSKVTGLLTEKSANVPHIIEAFNDIPNGTILLGEIYYPGKTSKDCTSIMGCLPQKAIERQNKDYGPIHYYVYDCLGYNGTSLLTYDNWTRYQVLQAIWKKDIIVGSVIPWTIELADAVEENIYTSIGQALAAGEEGMVVKKKTALYESGKRPQTMLKAKQVDYIDAVIIGFKDPVKEYTGKEVENWQYWVGTDDHEERLPIGLHYGDLCAIPVTKHYYYEWKNAIEIGAYDSQGQLKSIGTIASGLTDFMREDMSLHPEKYLYKVVSIQCMSLDKTAQTIRHGFLITLRNDKNKEECLLQEIFK